MKFFHSEDHERVTMAVEAALACFRDRVESKMHEYAAVAVSEEIDRIRPQIKAAGAVDGLTEPDRARFALFQGFVAYGADPTEAMKVVMAERPGSGAVESHVVDLREISDDDARAEISRLFGTDSSLYYSDICDQTRLPLEQVVRVCNQLMFEGRIGVARRA